MLKQDIIQNQIISQTMALNLSILKMNRTALNILVSNIADKNPLVDATNYYVPWKHNKTVLPDIIEHTIQQEKNLYELLREELFLELDESDEQLLYLIIGNLNKQGFLPFCGKKICQGTSFDPLRFEEIRNKVISSSYKGLASFNSKEYLLFVSKDTWGQTSVEYALAQIIVTRKKPPTSTALAKLLTISEDSIIKGLNNLKRISSTPLGENSKNIYPDFLISIEGDHINIAPATYLTPHVAINDSTLGTIYTKKEIQNFLKEAQNLQQTLILRHDGIQKHIEALVLSRSDFFFNDSDHPKVIGLKDIAKITGRHISTVSRALKDRYFLFNQEIYPFSILLAHKVGNSTNFKIKQMIQKIINTEDEGSPLSDENITKILNKQGIKIARRTVHKYRTQMKIDPLYKR